MNFQCKNCGGNMVFSPKMQKMYCPYCDGTDCEEKRGDASVTVCYSCGGEINVDEFTSATKCPYCGNYLVLDPRVEGVYEPKEILPFKLSKEEAVSAMEKEFKKRIFTPNSFLSEKTLVNLEGMYVPFFLYDFKSDADYRAEGTKTRHWRSGNYRYTETSYYDIVRKLNVDFKKIPADASTKAPDYVMDLMEPYDYNDNVSFDPKFMSGFNAEIYNAPDSEYIERAKQKAIKSVNTLINDSVSGYSTVRNVSSNVSLHNDNTAYVLFPVWVYKYSWAGKEYVFHVNGQTGKVVGTTPVSLLKVIIYGITKAGLTWALVEMISRLFGGLVS